MAADSRLCPLPHLYLDRGSRFEILLMNSETSGSNLNYRIFTVAVKVLVKSALSGIVIKTELRRRAGKAFVSIIAYRAVAHGGKHYRHRQLKLRIKRAVKSAV